MGYYKNQKALSDQGSRSSRNCGYIKITRDTVVCQPGGTISQRIHGIRDITATEALWWRIDQRAIHVRRDNRAGRHHPKQGEQAGETERYDTHWGDPFMSCPEFTYPWQGGKFAFIIRLWQIGAFPSGKQS